LLSEPVLQTPCGEMVSCVLWEHVAQVRFLLRRPILERFCCLYTYIIKLRDDMKCQYCNKEFANYRALNGHKTIHTKPIRKERSDKGVFRVDGVEFKKFECLNCSKCIEYKHYSGNKDRQYCSHSCQMDYQYKSEKLPLILEGKLTTSSPCVERYLNERDGRKCSICNLEKWNKQDIPLDIDHIDGNPTNDKGINLRYLCPNCHRLSGLWGNCAAKRSSGQMGRRRLDMARSSKFDSCEDHQDNNA
jgi:hypothetical protein